MSITPGFPKAEVLLQENAKQKEEKIQLWVDDCFNSVKSELQKNINNRNYSENKFLFVYQTIINTIPDDILKPGRKELNDKIKNLLKENNYHNIKTKNRVVKVSHFYYTTIIDKGLQITIKFQAKPSKKMKFFSWFQSNKCQRVYP